MDTPLCRPLSLPATMNHRNQLPLRPPRARCCGNQAWHFSPHISKKQLLLDWRHHPGAIAPLAAVMLVVLLAFVAFAVDIGIICTAKGELQNAADAAALAAAGKLTDSKEGVAAQARKSARTYAGLNSARGESPKLLDTDIVLGHWDDRSASFTPLTGEAERNANAVQVTCARTTDRGNPIRLCFGPVIGTGLSDVTATATARVKPSRCGLIIGLASVTLSGNSYTDSYDSELGSYPAGAGENGHVCTNGNITMSGSTTIHGDAHPGRDHALKRSGSSDVSGDIKSLVEPLSYSPADPGDALWNNDNHRIPDSDRGNAPLNSKNEFTLSGGDTISLVPGTYFFQKMSLSGGSGIKISGPTIIYVQLDCSLSGGSVTNLTAIPKNLQLFPMGSKCTISGSSEFYGVIYGPQTKVERSGSSEYFGSIIARNLVLSGSGGIHADDSLDLPILSQGRGRSILVD